MSLGCEMFENVYNSKLFILCKPPLLTHKLDCEQKEFYTYSNTTFKENVT
jgi:hypothetical protein